MYICMCTERQRERERERERDKKICRRDDTQGSGLRPSQNRGALGNPRDAWRICENHRGFPWMHARPCRESILAKSHPELSSKSRRLELGSPWLRKNNPIAHFGKPQLFTIGAGLLHGPAHTQQTTTRIGMGHRIWQARPNITKLQNARAVPICMAHCKRSEHQILVLLL